MTVVIDKLRNIELTTEIVSAYVSQNNMPADEVPALIASVHSAVAGLASSAVAPVVETKTFEPFVPVKKSITDDYLISLFDGRKFKSLKRHLQAEHGMTPEDYRKAFSLPASYPMVAPNYAAARSQLAKTTGLGRKVSLKVVA